MLRSPPLIMADKPSSSQSMTLSRADLAADPYEQFKRWYGEWLATEPMEPTAMTLATASRTGVPSARIVLLKHWDANGFQFFTNYGSRKARDLEENPVAELLFFWPQLNRQVRICGGVSRVTREESGEYFRSRPRLSRLGAWASRQSAVIANREVLDKRIEEMDRRFPGEEVPLPEFWGGYRLRPASFEFWQARMNRVHDRFVYGLRPDGTWVIERLSP
jgi:pyridoxamine 5'-phosphate oxidase